MSLKETFTDIFQSNSWKSNESVSGAGSELKATSELRKQLSYFFSDFSIKSILDIPCGDFNWMKEVDLRNIEYYGADIVEELITANKAKYPLVDFQVLDLTTDPLPKVDLIFVRDCLGHLSDENIFKALENIQKSGSKYLAVTSFTSHSYNRNIPNGSWKPINLFLSPYFLRPIYLINEDCQEGYPYYNDKCIIVIDLKNMFIKQQ